MCCKVRRSGLHIKRVELSASIIRILEFTVHCLPTIKISAREEDRDPMRCPPCLSYISIEVQRTLFSILCSQKQEAATGEPRTTRLDCRSVLYNVLADIGVDHRQKGPSSVFQNPRVLSILGFSGGGRKCMGMTNASLPSDLTGGVWTPKRTSCRMWCLNTATSFFSAKFFCISGEYFLAL